MKRRSLVIVTPALREANNGNWQTAQRWARMLQADYRVRLAAAWEAGDEALLIALHARRSAASVAAWRQQRAGAPILLVLTGTDLYRDIAHDPAAQRSLNLADGLVVLNELGLDNLPQALRAKARVSLQSCTGRQPRPKPARHLRALMVGHLREEKSPQTFFAAARALVDRHDILFDHIGGALDSALADEARRLMQTQPRYRWLGSLPHAATRARIASASLLVHPSRMEGGAHVVMEAITSGTPVLASRIDGNLGLLGRDYLGVFDPGDVGGLVRLLEQARGDATMLPALQTACSARAPLFAPERERQALLACVRQLLDDPPFPGDPA